MAWTRAALAVVAAGAVGVAFVSGGSSADPRTPTGLPGLPAPFLGVAAVGDGGLTAAVDAYGDVVDLRTPGPAGRALIDNPSKRQLAGTVPVDTGIVPRVRIGGAWRPLWEAERVSQHYRPGSNVLVTAAKFGSTRVEVIYAARHGRLACLLHGDGSPVSFGAAEPGAASRLRCDDARARRFVRGAERSDRRWLARARGLGAPAPPWARQMYRRSLLALRALADRHSGAVAAGARDGWAYVWPRDAGAVALALAASGYRPEAQRIARFLRGLDLDAAARFSGDGAPVEGRGAQGDAIGWAAIAARAAGLPRRDDPALWRGRADYQEGAPGDYLANAIAAAGAGAARETRPGRKLPPYRETAARRPEPGWAGAFRTTKGLVRRAGEPSSGLDSAAAWAVRPFPQPTLFPAVRRTLLRLTATRTRFGIAPGEGWTGVDPWTAPTAWSAWSLAALGERHAALDLLGDLRRAATPAGALPERVEARTGVPVSTTPLAWSHAFAILALRQLWP